MTNNVVLIIDNSSSIDDNGLTSKMIECQNRILTSLQEKARRYKQKTNVTILTFDNRVNYPLCQNVDIKAAVRLTPQNYRPYGNTALLDAVGEATVLMDKQKKVRGKQSYLYIVLTDGQENNSSTWKYTLVSEIQKRQAAGKSSFVFQVPYGYKSALANRYNIPIGNIEEWEGTERGLEVVTEKTSAGLDNYYQATKRGLTSVCNFYAQTDMGDVKKKDLKQNLDDVSKDYRLHTVTRTQQIRDAVERLTHRPYSKGDAFYCLEKPEIVQAKKEVLVQDGNKLYGGDNARLLVGLPPMNAGKCKVVPGNHGNYNIFVQSTSHNRRLDTGTKIAVKV